MRLSQVENNDHSQERDIVYNVNRSEIAPMSPIRKQLVKDLTSYYNLLYETDLLNEATEKVKPHDWKGNSSNQEATYFQPRSGYQQFEIDLMQYNEPDARNSRLEELKALMKSELEYIEMGHPVDPTSDEWEQTVKGYPSFMQDRDEKHRNFHCGVHYKDPDFELGGVSKFRSDMHGILEHFTKGTVSDQDVTDLRFHLLTLRTKRNYMLRNTTDEKLYDFHQRKGKEIRRRQYSSWLRERNNIKNVEDRYPSPKKFERVLISLGGMFNTNLGKQKFVRIGEKLSKNWAPISIGGLFRTENGDYEYVVIPREVLLDLDQNVNENLLGFGVFYENAELDHDWIKLNDVSTEPGTLLYIGARFCYEDNKEMRYFIRRIEWIEVRDSYYDWVFVNEEFALRVHRKRNRSKEPEVVQKPKPSPKRPDPVKVENRVKRIINEIDTKKSPVYEPFCENFQPQYAVEPSPSRSKLHHSYVIEEPERHIEYEPVEVVEEVHKIYYQPVEVESKRTVRVIEENVHIPAEPIYIERNEIDSSEDYNPPPKVRSTTNKTPVKTPTPVKTTPKQPNRRVPVLAQEEVKKPQNRHVNPKVEKKPEPKVPKKPEPKVQKKPEPSVPKKPETKVQKKPDPVVEKKPEPVVEKKPESVSEKKSESVPEDKPESVPEDKPEPEVRKITKRVVKRRVTREKNTSEKKEEPEVLSEENDQVEPVPPSIQTKTPKRLEKESEAKTPEQDSPPEQKSERRNRVPHHSERVVPRNRHTVQRPSSEKDVKYPSPERTNTIEKEIRITKERETIIRSQRNISDKERE